MRLIATDCDSFAPWCTTHIWQVVADLGVVGSGHGAGGAASGSGGGGGGGGGGSGERHVGTFPTDAAVAVCL